METGEEEEGPWMVVPRRSSRQQQQRDGVASERERHMVTSHRDRTERAWSKKTQPHPLPSRTVKESAPDDHDDHRKQQQQQDGVASERERHLVTFHRNRTERAWSKKTQPRPLPPRTVKEPAPDDHDDHRNNHDDNHRDDCDKTVNPSDLIGAPVVMGVAKQSRDKSTRFKLEPPHYVREGGERRIGGLLRVKDMQEVMRGGLLRVKDMQEVMRGRRDGHHDDDAVKKEEEEEDVFELSAMNWPGVGRGGGGASGASSGWSAVVKADPKPRPPLVIVKEVNDDIGSMSDSEVEGGGDDDVRKDKKKKQKKSSAGFTFDLSEIVGKLNVDRPAKAKPVSLFSTGPVVPRDKGRRGHGADGPSPNKLDSSAPIARRGKEREKPKKKRLSAIRKVILKEKEERKRLREGGVAMPAEPDVMVEEEEVEEEEEEDGCGTDTDKKTESTIPNIHNRRFRDYCTHMITDDINDCAAELLIDLVRFQDRVYRNEPQKLKTKRRYVCGMREVKNSLSVRLRKVECVIVPPNLDRIQSTGGIDDHITAILHQASQTNVRIVFALSRRRLAWVLKKKNKVSCVSIFSYAGAEDKFHNLMSLVDKASEDYDHKSHPLPPTISPTTTPTTASRHVSPVDSDSSDSDHSVHESVIPSEQWSELFTSNGHLPGAAVVEEEGTGGEKGLNPNAAAFTPLYSLTTTIAMTTT